MESLKIINENNIIEQNESLIGKYLDYIDVSENTQKEYYSGLKLFFEYCKLNNINNIQRNDIIDYRQYLQQQGKSANTINLYLVSIKNFFKWLEYEGLYKDISKNIKSMPISSVHTRDTLNINQIKQLLNYCQNDKERIIISLAISTGMRCNEMCNIRVQDFASKNGVNCLYVLGKARNGMRTDYVIVPDNILNDIKQYIINNNINEYLFISNSNNNKGKPISTRSMRDIVNNIYQRAGIKNENIVFHSLRHSFCNLNLQNGIAIQEVSMAMRHKSIATTMRYVKDIEAQNNKCFNNISNLLFA